MLVNPGIVNSGPVAQKVFPPIGLMYLVAALKQAGEPGRLIDANATGQTTCDIERLSRCGPGGRTSVFDIACQAARLAHAIRARFPSVVLLPAVGLQ